MNMDLLLNKKLGDRINIRNIDTGLNQKELSKILQEHGWKKDYNYPGEWVRVSEWPYLGYYESKKYGVPYAELRFREHIGDATELDNRKVHVYCGMPLTQAMVDAVMTRAGWTREGDVWRKNK